MSNRVRVLPLKPLSGVNMSQPIRYPGHLLRLAQSLAHAAHQLAIAEESPDGVRLALDVHDAACFVSQAAKTASESETDAPINEADLVRELGRLEESFHKLASSLEEEQRWHVRLAWETLSSAYCHLQAAYTDGSSSLEKKRAQ